MGIWRDKKYGYWCYKFQYQNKQYGSTGFRTRQEAVTERELHRLRVQSGLSSIPKLSVVISQYMQDCKRRFVPKTWKAKESVFRKFLALSGNCLITEVKPMMVDSYLATCPSNNNFNVHRKELSALFNYAVSRLEVLEANPVSKIPKLPHSPKRKHMIDMQHVRTLVSVAHPRNQRPFILCIILLAARVDEIQRLLWSDVDLDQRTVTRWTRKRHNGSYEPITVYICDDLLEQFQILRQYRLRRSRYVFPNPMTGKPYKNRRKMLYNLCDKAGIPRIHYHELRHFTASILANSPDVSKKTISSLLGHKSLQTTEIYLHSIDSSEKQALASLDGRFLNSEQSMPLFDFIDSQEK